VSFGDIGISLLVAIVAAVVVLGARRFGSEAFHRIRTRLPVLMAGGLAVGLCAVLFHEISGRPLSLVLFSGESGIGEVLTESSVAVLIGLVFAKGIAYAISIGAGFRGGPVFPALFLGVAVAVLAHSIDSDYSITAAVATGVAAGASAALRAPFFGALIAALLVGTAGTNTIPLAVIAAVVAWLIAMAVSGPGAAQPEVPQDAPPQDDAASAPAAAGTRDG
jgi:H+/Cl- antiporter ClcA